ncbi:MAG: 5-(carboxyamino)imidazole ribonucleotide synthase [Candidatus Izimaplasma sp.]|nr:5-(carboxyamino)imidazole ribonucleotide synthase [Candidatus Izimaplasma bacterium]
MKIGIVGGGQLGMMMTQAAQELGHYVICLDPNKTCSTSYYADEMVIGDYNNTQSFKTLADKCDVITYEFENVDLKLIETYQTMIPQKAKALQVSRHRLIEKTFAQTLEIPTPRFKQYIHTTPIKYPCVIKTATGGYDGKGQFYIKSKDELNSLNFTFDRDYIVESLIAFDYEISCVLTRDKKGVIAIQPIPINTHDNGILSLSDISQKLPNVVLKKATDYATRIITKLDYVGTLGVEFFVKDNIVLFNEFAPRPHNSGHFSIEGTSVSQFTNHILAITGKDILPVSLKAPTIMINILGKDIALKELAKDISFAHLHMYHKTENRPNRKMGHITLSHPSDALLKQKSQQLIEAIQ